MRTLSSPEWGLQDLPPGVKTLMGLTLGLSLACQVLPDPILDMVARPNLVFPWTLLLAGFVAWSPIGLVLALYALFAFGSTVEGRLGSTRLRNLFLGTTFLGHLAAALWATARLSGRTPPGDAVSGLYGIVALVAAFGWLHRGAIVNFFFLFPVNAWKLVQFGLFLDLLYIVYSQGWSFHAVGSLTAALVALGALEGRLGPALDLPEWVANRFGQWRRGRQAARFTVIRGGASEDRGPTVN